MKYAVEVAGAIIYITSFIKIGQDIQELTGGTHRHKGDLIRLFFSKQKKKTKPSLQQSAEAHRVVRC
jgi:beta-galactosidase beta subunit